VLVVVSRRLVGSSRSTLILVRRIVFTRSVVQASFWCLLVRLMWIGLLSLAAVEAVGSIKALAAALAVCRQARATPCPQAPTL
jgi:hypothetical protein